MTLALIAGRGALPAAVAAAADTPVTVCAYEGVAPDILEADLTFRLETLGSLFKDLRARDVTAVCFAGAIDRPQLDPTKLDAETAPLVPVFMEALQKGDDGALRIVMDLFERTGFAVIGADTVAPDLLAQGGVHSDVQPDDAMRRDAQIAAAHIRELSPKDLGQACVVGQGEVLAMEDISGTDAMLSALQNDAQGKRAILFKGPKAGQTRKIDLPTVGPDTFRAAAAAGLAGVIVDAGDVLVLDAPACIDLARQHGLVFWARTDP